MKHDTRAPRARILLPGILATAMLAGCATVSPAQRAADLNASVGESEAALVQQRGAPTSVAQQGDNRLLTYDHRVVATLPGSGLSPYGPLGHWATYPIQYGAEPPTPVVKECRVTFDVNGGKVISWSQAGNDC
jgi:hypothetical protein